MYTVFEFLKPSAVVSVYADRILIIIQEYTWLTISDAIPCTIVIVAMWEVCYKLTHANRVVWN